MPKIIPDLAKELNLTSDRVINIFDAMGGANLTGYEKFCDGQFCDYTHPNDAGYTFMANYIFKLLYLSPIPTKLVNEDKTEFLV